MRPCSLVEHPNDNEEPQQSDVSRQREAPAKMDRRSDEGYGGSDGTDGEFDEYGGQQRSGDHPKPFGVHKNKLKRLPVVTVATNSSSCRHMKCTTGAAQIPITMIIRMAKTNFELNWAGGTQRALLTKGQAISVAISRAVVRGRMSRCRLISNRRTLRESAKGARQGLEMWISTSQAGNARIKY